MESRTAIVIGGSRGLGLGLVQALIKSGWNVIATVRDDAGHKALSKLGHATDTLSVKRLDMTSQPEIAALRADIADAHFDLIFVNAGVAPNPEDLAERATTDDFVVTMTTNALAPLRVIGALHHLLRDGGTIAVMSSNMGSVSENRGTGWEIYRASKAALNQLLRSFAARRASEATFLAVSPGWVKTEMGGTEAPLTVETSAEGILNTIEKRWGVGGVHFVNYQNQDVPW